MIQNVFKRYEKKYMLSKTQKEAFQKMLTEEMVLDEYGESTICNIYYDTPDFRLIRESLEKPVYKEKLRLRTYGVPSKNSPAFVEIKKKYKGIVYKRRVTVPYEQAFLWMLDKNQQMYVGKTAFDTQIVEEIDWFRSYYKELRPTVVLCYDRCAWYGVKDPNLRVTFDRNIRCRTSALNLESGDQGRLLLPEDTYLMELKIAGAMPMWMAEMLDTLQIYPISFSKYGTAYKTYIKGGACFA